jgi:hypothetical protein
MLFRLIYMALQPPHKNETCASRPCLASEEWNPRILVGFGKKCASRFFGRYAKASAKVSSKRLGATSFSIDSLPLECPANFVPVRNIRNWHERSFVWDEGRGINRSRW